MLVNGTLTARSGEVDMTVTPPSLTDSGFLPNQGIWLGAGAKTAAGYGRMVEDAARLTSLSEDAAKAAARARPRWSAAS